MGCRQEETQSGVNHTPNRAAWRVPASSLPPSSPLPPSVPPSLEPRIRTVTHRCKFPTHPWNPRNGRKEANNKIYIISRKVDGAKGTEGSNCTRVTS